MGSRPSRHLPRTGPAGGRIPGLLPGAPGGRSTAVAPASSAGRGGRNDPCGVVSRGGVLALRPVIPRRSPCTACKPAQQPLRTPLCIRQRPPQSHIGAQAPECFRPAARVGRAAANPLFAEAHTERSPSCSHRCQRSGGGPHGHGRAGAAPYAPPAPCRRAGRPLCPGCGRRILEARTWRWSPCTTSPARCAPCATAPGRSWSCTSVRTTARRRPLKGARRSWSRSPPRTSGNGT
jgi:hypothetical protein